MRYKQLQAAREILINAAKHLRDTRVFRHRVLPSGELHEESYLDALEVIHTAVSEVREELKHPERFNLDGTRREVKWVKQ